MLETERAEPLEYQLQQGSKCDAGARAAPCGQSEPTAPPRTETATGDIKDLVESAPLIK